MGLRLFHDKTLHSMQFLTKSYKKFGSKSKWILLAFFVCIILSINGCGSTISYAPVINGIYQAKNGIYTVKAGDSLYSIAWNFGKDYRTLARLNSLNFPYALHPGQRLVIKSAKSKKRAIIIKPRSSRKIKRSVYRLTSTRKKSKAQASRTYAHRKIKLAKAKIHKTYAPRKIKLAKVTHWRWPANGKIVAKYSPRDGNKGIEIANHSGSPVYAAAAGIVVYRGSGLAGYGKLIIIKHNSEYLSAYAYNRRLLVRENQMVKAGQKIAEMGHTGAKRNMLHFEIRRAGKPRNPLNYLPKR